MIYALAILIVTAAVCYGLSLKSSLDSAGHFVAPAGAAIALVIALTQEGLRGAGTAGAAIAWPDFMSGLGPSFYWSDTLAASLGAWCILLGGLCLTGLWNGERAGARVAAATMLVASLYSLVYTVDLRAFAGHILLVVLLVLTVLWHADASVVAGRQRVALMAGALALLGDALLVGRITGGVYNIQDVSLSALTFWPLLLVLVFVVFWLGLAPVTGWSGLVQGKAAQGTQGALLQGLVLGVPALVLVLRLQALITQQALAGSVPPDWGWFTGGSGWLGGITTLTGGAGVIVWAGTSRWSAALTAYVMGTAVWALSLDTPTGRYGAIAVVLAYGLGRLALDLSRGQHSWLSRLVAGISLVGAPLTSGFVGIWLLAGGLVETRHVSVAIVLAGAAILAACGAALHLAMADLPQAIADSRDRYLRPLGLILSLLLVAGGALPSLWLPQVEAVAAIAGGGSRLDTGWAGPGSGGIFVPLTLMSGAVLLVMGIGWLLRVGATSRSSGNSVLLPTAIARLQRLQQNVPPTPSLPPNPPPAVWWLSLVWLEQGLYGFGAVLNRLATRFGVLLARLEGRYYFPLALILTLLILLAITR